MASLLDSQATSHNPHRLPGGRPRQGGFGFWVLGLEKGYEGQVETHMLKSIPIFEVDLDLPPEQRWIDIIDKYSKYWGCLVDKMYSDLRGEGPMEETPEEEQEREWFVLKLCESVCEALEKVGRRDFVQELQAAAKLGNVRLQDLLLLNLGYESSCGCTTILGLQSDGHVIMGRTLDWVDSRELVELTIEIHFIRSRSRQLLYKATSWAGYFGILTAMRPKQYCVSVNHRVTSSGLEKRGAGAGVAERGFAMIEDFHWPVGYAVRYVLENFDDYRTAVNSLSNLPLLGPAYFLVAGVGENGILLTRDEKGLMYPVQLLSTSSAMTVCEADALHQVTHPRWRNTRQLKSRAGRVLKKLYQRKGKTGQEGENPSTTNNEGADKGDCKDEGLCARVLVQANMDHWDNTARNDHQESLPRRSLAHSMLKKMGYIVGGDRRVTSEEGGRQASSAPSRRANVAGAESEMWDILYTYPIWDERDTIYATVMCPASSTYENSLQCPKGKGKSNQKLVAGKKSKLKKLSHAFNWSGTRKKKKKK